MNTVTDNINLVKTLRKNPKGFVLTSEYKIKYWKDERETIYSHEYLVYENLSDGGIDTIELITRPSQ